MSAQARPIKVPAPAAMLEMIQGFWVSQAICVAAELGIPDLLKEGPRTSEELASAIGAHAPSLFHGHEALDTDTTPNLEGEAWLLRNGFTQAEGVANLDKVPEKGALVAIGFPKLRGGTGGYARYIAICPPHWKYGVSVGEVP